MPELVVTVSSCNRQALLREALDSLARHLPGTPIVVFDAGSTDGSLECLHEFQKKAAAPVHLLSADPARNSFSEGVNSAAAFALNHYPDARFLLLFETDNLLRSPQPVAAAMKLLQKETQLGAAGFTVRKRSGAPAGFGCSFPSLLQFALGPQLSHRLRLDAPKLDWRTKEEFAWSECPVVYTSPILIKRGAWEKSGGFDAARFPFADCDLDWARRLRALGFLQAVVKTDAVIHDNQEQLSSWSSTRVLHFHRARLELLCRHQRLLRWALCPLLSLRHLLELAALALRFRPAPDYAASLRKRWLLLTRVFHGYRLK